MERDYTVSNVEIRDQWAFQGKQMQDYAIAFQGEDGWIKLTQNPQTPPPKVGDTIHGIIEMKTNSNGKSYRKFKKVTGFGRQPAADTGKTDYMVQMLEELTGRRKPDEFPVTEKELEDPLSGLL